MALFIMASLFAPDLWMSAAEEATHDAKRKTHVDTSTIVPAQVPKVPYTPTTKGRQEPFATHVPFRSWCEHCVVGTPSDVQRRQTRARSFLITVTSLATQQLRDRQRILDTTFKLGRQSIASTTLSLVPKSARRDVATRTPCKLSWPTSLHLASHRPKSQVTRNPQQLI